MRLIVPATAGSSLDIVARLLADRLKERWGQPLVVDNRPGAGGVLGTDLAAKSAPDGHTLLLSFNGPIAYAPALFPKLPYAPERDLQALVMTSSQPNVLAIHAGLPVRTMAEFLAWARQRDGAMNYASLGNGSSAHLTMALFLSETGIKATHIPYNGSPQAALAVAQGDVDAAFMVVPALLPHSKSGRVRLLALSTSERPDSLKAIPTLASLGLGSVESLAWNGLFAPAGTPESVGRQINTDVNAVLGEPALRAAFDAQGLLATGGSAEAFRALIATDARRWGALIRRLGMTVE
jgi:tripartite-type tricarboxylate transporter receptor subunit TctC